ncbi:type VI secretion system protein ImpL [Geomonas paludis]|uniref:Type VI secretion system protein ImpL n=1 Tax=Geomonas paludis TaxID=2740185 RepID=A0A6V8MYI1_9BACT|nr:type VI secretion protein IcmF/TssM N-terminal domain-containing protein [Geomonas paludis]UPU34832.1 type VI secretion system protein ImpL [Geomonas paludis]GFO64717.1 type VI secretion system protein ImpL [Geomonas paludis]
MQKYTVLTCCKYLLFGAALLPITVVAFVMIPLLTWPWRIGIFLPFIVLLLWGALEWLKKLVQRAQQDKEQPVPQGAEAAQDQPAHPPRAESAQLDPSPVEPARQDRILELQQNFRAAVRTLKGSHLKQEGDPLHVLPWYLLLGAGGSGKTSAVRGARLLSPFSERPEHEATANCSWHFYDQGIVIDTAGRYAVPADAGGDHDEWLTFLSLLKRYRRTELINGVMVTVAADSLLAADPAQLEEQGRQLRCRIEEMIRHLGVTFPVYLLITKCDLVSGMSEFCGALPSGTLDQPVGLLNRELDADLPRLLERFCDLVDERMRMLRLLLLHHGAPAPANGRLLLFPDQLRELRPGLELFMPAAFGQNHYQETPFLRGIYLCSALPVRPLSRHLPGDPQHVAAAHAPFLHDLFEKVLPRDRGLCALSARTLKWRRLSDNLALVCWLLIGISLCAMLTGAFVKNIGVLRLASYAAAGMPRLQGDTAADLAALEAMRRAIVEVELKNRNWWLPRFGLSRSREVEQALKARYCQEYRKHLLAPFDAEMAGALDALSPALPDSAFGGVVLHLSRRCNLLKGRLAGEDETGLASHPVPDYRVLAAPAQGWSDPAAGNLYLAYVAWLADPAQMSEELQRLQQLLKRLVLLKGADFSWVLGYVDREQTAAPISLQEFWGGSRALQGEPSLAACFTRNGRERITAVLGELSTAYPEREVLERARAEFWRSYREAAFNAWQSFAAQLPAGALRLLAPKEWQSAAAAMAGEQGPYFNFMRRALTELQPFDPAEPLPVWIAELYRFQALKGAGPAGVASSLSGQASRVAGTIGRLGGKKENLPGDEQSANLAREYLNAVAQIAPVAKSRALAHRMALQAFGDSAESGKSPLFQAAEAAQRLNQLLVQGQGDDTFARLIYGPITFYGTYIRMETACALQAQWEQTVLKEVQGSRDPQSLQYLLGKDGPVWKYVGDYVNPFIGWSPARGYFPKSALGGSIPFKPEFYSFLAQGGKAKLAAAAGSPKPVYHVTIKGLPTDANAEARVKPQGTRLELHCATGVQSIVNMNYPVSRPFVYLPDACSDVVLQIDVGDTTLTRRYLGSSGFTEFLRDFPAGRHTFYPRNFPQEKEALQRLGVRFIKVNYQLFGAGDLAAQPAETLPARVPVKIAECWD